MTKVMFTAASFSRLKDAYANAVEHDLESFVFDGSEWLTNYAKYAIEHLSRKFGNNDEEGSRT